MKKKYTPGGCRCCHQCVTVDITSFEIASGTAISGTSTTIRIEASPAFLATELAGHVIGITGGTGSGQSRTVTTNGSPGNTLTVSPAWTTTPDNTSTYSLKAKDNGDGSFSWLTGTATPDQNVSASDEAYGFQFRADQNCTIHVEGFDIVFSATNQTITLDGNTEIIRYASGHAGDYVDFMVHVTPDYVYVAALGIEDTEEYLPSCNTANPRTNRYINTGTCLTADFASPPHSHGPTWYITNDSAQPITLDKVWRQPTNVMAWSETRIYSNVSSGNFARVGTASQFLYATSETFADNELADHEVEIVAGTGAGQVRRIVTNYAATDQAIIGRAWDTALDATSEYSIAEITTNCTRGAFPIWCHYGHLENIKLRVSGITGTDTVSVAYSGFAYTIRTTAAPWGGDTYIWWAENYEGCDNGTNPVPNTAYDVFGYEVAGCHWFGAQRVIWQWISPDVGTAIVNTFTPGVGLAGLAWYNPSTVTYVYYKTGGQPNVDGNVSWAIDEPKESEPYPKPRWIAYLRLQSYGFCREPGAGQGDNENADGTEIVNNEAWTMADTTITDIAINSLSAGFTIACTATYVECPSYPSMQNFWVATGASGNDPTGQSTTITWTT